MAEEIYREWFVRLRFPGYQNTQFIKGIPEGWEIARVDSLGKVVTGKTPSTSIARYYNGQYPFIKTPDMHGNMFILETSESLSDDGIQSQASQTIPKGSLCVSCIGTGGIVSITTERSQTNQQINSICLKRLEDLEWGYFVLQGLKETIQLFGSTGTTMTNLSKGKFSGLKFFSPPIELRNNFHSYVEAFFSEIQVLATTNRNLTKTRDLLLPRLISGKLPVEHLDIQTPPSMNP
jgi:type I restriction enzyme S subunit